MKNGIYKLLGFVFISLAVIGFILPVLPGTPFLLLSAWCFARSSQRWYRWLVQNRLFGPIIRSWEENRCVSVKTKFVALFSMSVLGGSSAFFALDDVTVRYLIFLLMGLGAVSILSLKTCPKTFS